jgi:hypothetical protein
MRRLSKDQLARRERIIAEMARLGDQINDEIRAANEHFRDYLEVHLSNKIAAFNAYVDEAEELREEITSDQAAYFSERSESWQDGDAGQAYQEWIDEFEASADHIEVEPPEMEEVEFTAEIDVLVSWREAVDS